MTTRRAVSCATLLSLALTLLAPALASGDALLPLSVFPREQIAVETPGARRHLFEAWRADTPETRAQGLMFVKGLRPEQAMIFVYEPAQRVSMWMKNTLIPLDMLFVDAGGCVIRVHERARPGDLTSIESGGPVELVVELAGGTAATLGLARGDRVVRPEAGWPREPRSCSSSR